MTGTRIPTIAQLEAFIAIVEAGSLLAAARSSGIPRSTLRRQLTELEELIGQPLLGKKGGKLVPNGAGQLVLQRGRDVLAECAQLVRDARDSGDDLGRRIHMALPPGMPSAPFSAIWQAAQARFAEALTVRVVEDPLRLLDDGADMAFYMGESVPEGPWEAVALMHVGLGLFASTGYLKRHPSPTSLADLGRHTIVRWIGPGNSISNRLPLRDGTSMHIDIRMASNDEALLRRIASDGGGIALLPYSVLYASLIPDCQPIVPELVGCDLSVYLVVPNELSDARRPAQILNLIRSNLGNRDRES